MDFNIKDFDFIKPLSKNVENIIDFNNTKDTHKITSRSGSTENYKQSSNNLLYSKGFTTSESKEMFRHEENEYANIIESTSKSSNHYLNTSSFD